MIVNMGLYVSQGGGEWHCAPKSTATQSNVIVIFLNCEILIHFANTSQFKVFIEKKLSVNLRRKSSCMYMMQCNVSALYK